MSLTSAISQLRAQTGAPLKACKEALEATGYNIQDAILEIRKALKSNDLKGSSARIASEGLVVIKATSDQKCAVMIEINSQTDFAAREASFKTFAEQVAQVALKHKAKDLNHLITLSLDDTEETIEEARRALTGKLGENIQIRRMYFVEATEPSHQLGYYEHMGRRGCIVLLETEKAIAKDIAIHIVGSTPLYTTSQEVPQEVLDKEREIAISQAKEAGKAGAILEKIAEGSIKKFYKLNCLVEQDFIKKPEWTVAQYLEHNHAKLVCFMHFIVGEGIEKPITNFASEVMEQIKETF